MNNIWCILIPILAALFGAIFGWLLKSLFCNCDDEKNEIESLKSKNNKLEEDLKTCLAKKPTVDTTEIDRLNALNNKLDTDLKACLAKEIPGTPISSNLGAIATSITETEPTLDFNAGLAKAVLGKKIIADDLKVVEGIGPKISDLFNNEGIFTWYQLSVASIEKCQAVLNTGGKRYEIHNPSTWPQQAGLAFEGKWEELNALQDRLDGGVDRG